MTDRPLTEDPDRGAMLGRTTVYPVGYEPGLSKRELFAAMMMQGAMIGLGITAGEYGDNEEVAPEIVAIDAVKAADALLKVLAK